MNEVCDGEFMEEYAVEPGSYIRKRISSASSLEHCASVEHLLDEQAVNSTRGGHDLEKIYAAHAAAVEHDEGFADRYPGLLHLVKGYGLGEAGEGRNVTHQQEEIERRRAGRVSAPGSGTPISDKHVAEGGVLQAARG